MKKGYTVEIINTISKCSSFVHLKEDEKELAIALANNNFFAIVTEWCRFENGLGNYEVEIYRHDCRC